MTTPTDTTEAATNGDVSATYPASKLPAIKRSPSTIELVYATAYGFVIGFCIAAGAGIILAWAIHVTEGLDGE